MTRWPTLYSDLKLTKLQIPNSGLFSFQYARAQVIQYTVPIYVDGTVAVVPLKMGKDHSVLIRPFGWRVWAAALVGNSIGILGVI